MILALSRRKILILGGLTLVALIIAGISAGLYIHSQNFDDSTSNHSNDSIQSTDARGGGGVVTNGAECASIVKGILDKGGSVADAGIVGLLCEGVTMAQSTGLGGGFFATIYIKKTGTVETLDARETAPGAAHENMYDDQPELSKIGGLSIAVPGEVRGYKALHEKYGKLPWKELFPPIIDLCRRGYRVTKYLAKVYLDKTEMLKENVDFRDEFVDPASGLPKKEGDLVKRLKLANTLEIIAQEPDAMHDGSLTDILVQEIHNFGGIITRNDLKNYQAEWNPPLNVSLSDNLTLYTFPPPGSGAVLGHILGLLNKYMESDLNSLINWQRIVESFKYAYGKRTQLGDPKFNPQINEFVELILTQKYLDDTRMKMQDNRTYQDPAHYGANYSLVEDHGTAHINILAPNGDAISLTGTINLIFGSQRMSPTTGIIFNDEMDDFAMKTANYFGLPASASNYIKPGKRPLSSMCPTIILDREGYVRLLIGAAGGSRITTSAALVTLRHLWFGQDVPTSVAELRLHHQLFPMEISVDPGFPDSIINGLRTIGHHISSERPNGFGAVTAIANVSGLVDMAFDPRRSGAVVHVH